MIGASWSPVNAFEQATARRELRCRARRNPGARDLPLVAAGDLGRRAARAPRLRADAQSAGGDLGRPDADARPRRRHRRLGALGLRPLPPHRRARLPRGAEAAFYPLYPATRRRARARCSAATTSWPGSSSRSPPRSGRSCCWSASPRNGSAQTARGGRCSTSRSSRRRSSSRPSTRSRSSSSSASARSSSPSVGASLERALVVGLALLTRPTGLVLLPPLVLIAGAAVRRRARARCRRAAAATRCCSGGRSTTRGRFARRRGTWHRHLSPAGPLGGIWDGLRAGWAGVEQLASGSNTHVYWTAVAPARLAPLRTAALNLELLGFLVLFVALDGDRVAPVRRAVRPVRGAQPRAAAAASRARAGRCSRCRASAS